jgi:nitrous oxide reductase accessory protein NosL
VIDRRRFLSIGFVLTPLAAAALSACGRAAENWAVGMVPIKWDRDACTQCGMVISDRRFAAEVCGDQESHVFKFDDIGCTMHWLRDKAKDYPWSADPATHIWVADLASQDGKLIWLDARAARYTRKTSPMGYNFGASAQDQPGAIDFQTMRQQALTEKK